MWSVTRKVDHPCRLFELNETYHTASRAPFREQHDMASDGMARLNYALVLFRFCLKIAKVENDSCEVP